MKQWPVQDAKARFSELLETCLKEGPQVVTKRGSEAAVLVSLKDWQRLQGGRRTLKDLLLSEEARTTFRIPKRSQYRRRPPDALD